MLLPKKWDLEGFFSLYFAWKLKHSRIIQIINDFDSFNSFCEHHSKLSVEHAFQKDLYNNETNEIKSRTESVLTDAANLNVRIITFWDSAYPELLRNIFSPPLMLFVDGNFEIENAKLISIVGTRTNSLYGKLTTEKFVESFANNSVEIVSGLAFGIDSIAHRKACEMKKPSYAIVASGVDKLNSSAAEKLAGKIKDSGGAIISEYPCGTPAQRGYFPVRNRIISGFTKVTLIVESGTKSGTLITARFALEQNREVYAVPGNINSEKSKGCNELIKNNQAILCTDPDQILSDIGWKLKEIETKNDAVVLDNATERKLYNCIDNEPKQIDTIAEELELDIPQVMVGLLTLEFKGLIRQLPGKNFIKV